MSKFLNLAISFLLIFAGVPITGFAANLEQSAIVDSIKLSKTEVSVGESIKLNVAFSEKSTTKVKAGDTLTIKLPQMSDAFGEAGLFGSASDSGTEIKNAQGIVLGTLTVTSGEVIFTFNKNAEKLDNIRGKFSLYVSVKNTLGEKQNIENVWKDQTDFGVGISKEQISITRPGRDEGQTGGNPFFYKTGESQTDHKKPKWWLVVNPDRQQFYPYMQPTKIKDNVKVGHKLIEDSVYFSIGGRVNERLTAADFMAKGYGSFETDGYANFSAQISASLLNGSSVAIEYKTEIVDPTLESFENTAEATYPSYYPGIKDTTYKPQQVSHTVANYMSSAEIEGDLQNSVTITKVDGDNKELHLSGAVFNLLQNGEVIESDLITDANGKLIIKHLESGSYQLEEIKAPQGYVIGKNNIYDFEITETDTMPTLLVKNMQIKNNHRSLRRKKHYQLSLLRTSKQLQQKLSA